MAQEVVVVGRSRNQPRKERKVQHSFQDERFVDPVTGQKSREGMLSVLNKKRVTKQELDAVFLDESMV